MMSVPRKIRSTEQRTPSRRRWMFRLIAMLSAPGLIVAAELFCSVFGFGAAEVGDDPFVEFAASRPLFELLTDGDRYRTSEQRLGFFRRVEFDRIKPSKEFRIFVVGGSTVQGHPYSVETSFPSCLQTALQIADPSISWNVVNCGGVSYASYRLVPVVQECLQYQPDLVIFCEGHNEFLEDVTYAPIREQSPSRQSIGEASNQLRIVRLLRRMFQSERTQQAMQRVKDGVDQAVPRTLLTAEVDTILNHDGGLEAYHRDDRHAETVVEHFRTNLERMHRLCENHGVPLLIVQPPSNLADCPPFKSEFSSETTDELRRRIGQKLLEARSLSRASTTDAIAVAKEAVQLDPRFAASCYELGKLQLAYHDFEAARESLQRACDEDVCPLRMTSPLVQAMQETVTQFQIPLLNADDLLRGMSRNGVIGYDLLVDHVHPSFRGNEEIGIAIADWMIAAGFASPQTDLWQQKTREVCRKRLQSLSDLYFLKGRQKLEILRLWAAGRSGGPPLANSSTSAPKHPESAGGE
jgi:lysophospholipase L1-like esterase